MRSLLLRGLGGVFSTTTAALLATDLVVWWRTAGRRRGRPPPPDPPSMRPGSTASSAATWLAGLAGLAAMGSGALLLGRSWPVGASLACVGGFITVTGTRSRVAAIEVSDRELRVRFGGRPPFSVRWDRCGEVRPPRTPLGAWGIYGSGCSVTLMPSDLFGREWVLDAVIRSSGLEFARGSWRAGARVGRGPPG